MSNITDVNSINKKPSKLEEFKLFYEAIEVPNYLGSDNKAASAQPKNHEQNHRLSRRRR